MTPPAGPPTIPLELLEWLERRYPVKMPEDLETERSIWKRTGQVELVKLLRFHYEKSIHPRQ